MEYTAGSRPPEPLVYGIRPVNAAVGRGPPDGDSLLVATVDVDPLEQVSDPRHPRRQGRVLDHVPHEREFSAIQRSLTTEEFERMVERVTELIDDAGGEIATAGWLPGSDRTGTAFEPTCTRVREETSSVQRSSLGSLSGRW
jgi:hypothetical protein